MLFSVLPHPTTLKLCCCEAKKHQCLLKVIGVRSANYVLDASITWIKNFAEGLEPSSCTQYTRKTSTLGQALEPSRLDSQEVGVLAGWW